MLQKVASEKSPPKKPPKHPVFVGKNIGFLKDSNIKNITRKSKLPTSTIPTKIQRLFLASLAVQWRSSTRTVWSTRSRWSIPRSLATQFPLPFLVTGRSVCRFEAGWNEYQRIWIHKLAGLRWPHLASLLKKRETQLTFR